MKGKHWTTDAGFSRGGLLVGYGSRERGGKRRRGGLNRAEEEYRRCLVFGVVQSG